jgi:hypothetical protein
MFRLIFTVFLQVMAIVGILRFIMVTQILGVVVLLLEDFVSRFWDFDQQTWVICGLAVLPKHMGDCHTFRRVSVF